VAMTRSAIRQKAEELEVLLPFIRAMATREGAFCLTGVREQPDLEIVRATDRRRIGLEMASLKNSGIYRTLDGIRGFRDSLNSRLRTSPELWNRLSAKFPNIWLGLEFGVLPSKSQRPAATRLVLNWLTDAAEPLAQPIPNTLAPWIRDYETRRPIWPGFWFAPTGYSGRVGDPPLGDLLLDKSEAVLRYERFDETWLAIYDDLASLWARSFAQAPDAIASALTCLQSGRFDRVFLFDWYREEVWELSSLGWRLHAITPEEQCRYREARAS
jgi:hypothetical protein